VAIAAQPALVAHGLGYRLAQGDADIFDGVVAIDVQIALGLDVEVDQAMAGNLVEHVVEETDAGRELGGAGAVDVQAHPDLGFVGFAGDIGGAVGHKISFKALISASFSGGAPTVRRTQL
jgi:hypothetical protein